VLIDLCQIRMMYPTDTQPIWFFTIIFMSIVRYALRHKCLKCSDSEIWKRTNSPPPLLDKNPIWKDTNYLLKNVISTGQQLSSSRRERCEEVKSTSSVLCISLNHRSLSLYSVEWTNTIECYLYIYMDPARFDKHNVVVRYSLLLCTPTLLFKIDHSSDQS